MGGGWTPPPLATPLTYVETPNNQILYLGLFLVFYNNNNNCVFKQTVHLYLVLHNCINILLLFLLFGDTL